MTHAQREARKRKRQIKRPNSPAWRRHEEFRPQATTDRFLKNRLQNWAKGLPRDK